MAPPKRPWFRFYVEAITDKKLRRLRPDTRWLFVSCLAAARSSCEPGVLFVAEGVPMTTEDIMDFACLSRRQTQHGLDLLCGVGVLAWDDERAVWFVPRWNERQFENDLSTPRSQFSRDPQLRSVVRDRDQGRCRYCGKVVNWADRRGGDGGTYDHVDPHGGNEDENIVVACRSCNSRKGSRTPEESGMVVLEPGSGPRSDLGHVQDTENREQKTENREKTIAAVRPRDVLWDSLLATCNVRPEDVTASARGAYNRAVKDLRTVGAIPAEVLARGEAFRRRWPNASLTPTALARRWSELADVPPVVPERFRGISDWLEAG